MIYFMPLYVEPFFTNNKLLKQLWHISYLSVLLINVLTEFTATITFENFLQILALYSFSVLQSSFITLLFFIRHQFSDNLVNK